MGAGSDDPAIHLKRRNSMKVAGSMHFFFKDFLGSMGLPLADGLPNGMRELTSSGFQMALSERGGLNVALFCRYPKDVASGASTQFMGCSLAVHDLPPPHHALNPSVFTSDFSAISDEKQTAYLSRSAPKLCISAAW